MNITCLHFSNVLFQLSLPSYECSMLTQAVNKVWKNCWGVKTVSGPKKTQTVEGVALISTKAFFFANKAPGVNMIQKRQTVLVPRLRSFQLVNLCSILQCR